jgi:hypothetical protein
MNEFSVVLIQKKVVIYRAQGSAVIKAKPASHSGRLGPAANWMSCLGYVCSNHTAGAFVFRPMNKACGYTA